MSLTTSFRVSLGLIIFALLGLVVVLAKAEPVDTTKWKRVKCYYNGPAFEPPEQDGCFLQDASGSVRVPVFTGHPCLAQMEAAMRAMEPFNGRRMMKRTMQLAKDVASGQEIDAELNALMALLDRTEQQWVDVKRACWKQP